MNIHTLQDSLKYTAYSGRTLNNEQCIVLQNSLTMLQNENHFQQTYFWGKIFGINDDYFIAFGITNDALKGRTFYYSTNLLDWGMLPKAKKKAKSLVLLCKELFQGDTSFRANIVVDDTIKDLPSTGSEILLARSQSLPVFTTKVFKEEDRLAAVVALINEETALIPRGALIKRADGTVVENLAFKGLTKENAKLMNNYYHYRIPQQRWNINLLKQQDYNYSLDFLDTVDNDILEGRVWALKFCNGGQVSLLQSLYWPGMTCYHHINTPHYGFMYIGMGKRNMDLPFMI